MMADSGEFTHWKAFSRSVEKIWAIFDFIDVKLSTIGYGGKVHVWIPHN